MSIIRYTTPPLNTPAFSPLARLSAFQHDVDRFFDLPVFGRDPELAAGPRHSTCTRIRTTLRQDRTARHEERGHHPLAP